MSNQKRQLAAIMFTDIAGYTAMMGRDENKTIELLRNNRELQRPLIDQHGGKWLKEMGDGVLASFNSAYHAIQCAIDIQLTASQDLKNKIRIGIHLGDVRFEEDDVFGDGVNIASRLESIADPGGIYISESMYKAISANREIKSQYIGELKLKNVENKIGTYALSKEGLILPSKSKIKELTRSGSKSKSIFQLTLFYILLISFLVIGTWLLWSKFFVDINQEIRSIAILPFDNFTGDENQAYLVLGMHAGLISEVGQLGDIRVISKTSTLSYANTKMTIKEIANELNVDALIEASVFKENENIRFQIKLINAFPEERQIWSQTFNVDMSNILNLYSRITQNIANEIQLTLSPEEISRLDKKRKVNPKAYEAYLKGKFHMGFLNPESLETALEYFELAVQTDPEYAAAIGGIAGIWTFRKQMGFASGSEADPIIEEYLAKAIDLDSQNAEVYYWHGLKKIWTDFDWEEGEKSLKRSIELNPNFSEALAYYSHLLMILKRPDEMRTTMKKALELDPNNLLIQMLGAVELGMESKYDSCISRLNQLQTIMPDNPLVLGMLFLCYTSSDKNDLAINTLSKILSDETAVEILDKAYINSDFNNALNEAANISLDLGNYQLSMTLYAIIGNTDKTLFYLEQLYIRKDSWVPYMGLAPELVPYHNEPRFIEIMKGMNLPFGKLN